MEWLADEFVVLAMSANPEPMNAARYRQSERSIVEANADAMKTAVGDGLEVQRRVRRIGPELGIAPFGESPNIGGQRVQALPEAL